MNYDTKENNRILGFEKTEKVFY